MASTICSERRPKAPVLNSGFRALSVEGMERSFHSFCEKKTPPQRPLASCSWSYLGFRDNGKEDGN